MYFALIIPILSTIFLFFYFKKEITWWEFSFPSLSVALFIVIFTGIYRSCSSYSTEYRGSVITKAEYYEYWSTWVDRTCSRQVPCGQDCTTDTKGNTTCTTKYCTEYYDCSYCDENNPYWLVTDNYGNNWNIREEYYSMLTFKWSCAPVFINLNRRIEKHSGCGIDGDKYAIYWNNKIETSESAVTEVRYKNKIKENTSAFSYEKIPDEELSKLKLYEYPKYYDYYKQQAVLGLENLKIPKIKKDSIQIKYEYLNGLGYQTHNKTFILLFPDKPIEIAFKQEQYWIGGNKNELVICIGYDSKTNKLNWVKAFSWCDNKRVVVDAREEIMELKYLDLDKIYPKVYKIITSYFKPKNFEDFDYLEVEYATWTYWFVFIMSIVITAGVSYWIIINEFEN